MRQTTIRIALAAALTLMATGHAAAQAYPAKTVRIIVPQSPGGSTDTQARLIAKKLQENLGQNFLVDNRPGAMGLIGSELVARAPADGYTLMCAAGVGLASLKMHRKATFDPIRDLAAVGQISSAPQFVLVHRSVPATTVPELVALAKKHAGKLNAGSSGIGGANHLAIELLKLAAGIDVTHIAYKGSGPATTALMGGEVDMAIAGSIVSTPYIQAGKVRALAITSPQRSAIMPDVPTLASYYPGFESTNWWAMFAPAGTPSAVLNKVSAEVATTLKSPEIRDFFVKDGADAVGGTPGELAAFLRREVERYSEVIRRANIRIE